MTVDELTQELERHRQARAWPLVLQVINQLAELETDPRRQSRWYDAAAQLCRDELFQREDALEYFDRALDSSFADAEAVTEDDLPLALAPFRAIERMRTDSSEWKALDRAYRKMIVRVRGVARFDKLAAGLFEKLGELYRTRLDAESSAQAAFAEARRLDPTKEA